MRIKFYTETIFAGDTYLQGNKCAQIYADRDGFVHLFLMRSKDGSGDSLGNVVKNIGILN